MKLDNLNTQELVEFDAESLCRLSARFSEAEASSAFYDPGVSSIGFSSAVSFPASTAMPSA